MATTNYSWVLPTVGASTDTWGTELNTVLDSVDTDLKAVSDTVAAKLPLAGGTLTGGLTGTTITTSGAITATGGFVGALTGNATTATSAATLTTARDVSMTGPVVVSATSFDGSANLVLTSTIADAALSIAKTSGLQAALDGKEPTLAATQTRVITYGTAAPSGTPSDGDIYLQHDA